MVFEAFQNINEVGHGSIFRLERRPVNKKAHLVGDELFDLVAGTTRLELATSGVTGRRSNQN